MSYECLKLSTFFFFWGGGGQLIYCLDGIIGPLCLTGIDSYNRPVYLPLLNGIPSLYIF